MILVSIFSEHNVLSDKVKIYYIFEYQSNENRAFRLFWTPGIMLNSAHRQTEIQHYVHATPPYIFSSFQHFLLAYSNLIIAV